MNKNNQAINGTTCWVDLGTTDTEAAKKFYSEIFGYEIEDVPSSDGMKYTMLNVNKTHIGGLYQMTEEQKQLKMPPSWMTYILVESADEIMKEVTELGGKIIAGPFDVSTTGRMGILQDPVGAILAVWQPTEPTQSTLSKLQGTVCWVEAATNDAKKSETFYSKLFGWTPKQEGNKEMPYTVFNIGEIPATGLYTMPEVMDGIPPHWMIYFNVDDCDATVKKITSLGGDVKLPAKTIDEGRFAVVSDPQGAVFGVMTGSK